MSSDAIQPTSTEELADFLRDNADRGKKTVLPVGGGTALDFGNPVNADVRIETTGLNRIIDYPARDMTITAQAGVTIEALQSTLAEHRQQIPIDLANSGQTTIGGAIVANAAGSRRFAAGTFRDFLIGLTAVDARGRVFHAGGRVVKNVAGYDLCKMLTGSWGTLAVLTEVTLKVTPIPESSAWLWTGWETATELEDALASLVTTETRPVAIDVLNASAVRGLSGRVSFPISDSPYSLGLLVSGAEADVAWQLETLQRELASHNPASQSVVSDDRLLTELTELANSSFSVAFQASLPPSGVVEFLESATSAGFATLAHAGNGLVMGWNGSQPDLNEASENIITLRTQAESQGGRLIVTQCPAEWKAALDVFGSKPPAWELMRKLKAALDPQDFLSPGRLFGTHP